MNKTENNTTATAPNDWRARLRGGTPPEWISLALVGALVVGLTGGLALTGWVLDVREHAAQDRVSAQLASALAVVVAEWDHADVAPLTRALAGLTAIEAVNWTDEAGVLRLSWRRGAVSAPTDDNLAATPPTLIAPERAVTCEAIGADGQRRGVLTIEHAAVDCGGAYASLLGPWCVITIVALIAVGLYRRALRLSLRPFTAIERALRACDAAADVTPATIVLGESLGPVARGWNRVSESLAASTKRSSGGGDAGGVQAALRRLESTRYRQVIDRLPYGVLLLGDSQQIEYANAAASPLLGKRQEELVGTTLESVICEPALGQAVLAARARPGSAHFVDRALDDKSGGVMLRFHVQAGSLQTGGGGVTITIEDVTALRESQRARDNFLYHVTHELRTPLTNIHAYTETLAGPGFEDERTRKECYNVLISETERLSRLVEDVLSLSQLEVGSARLDASDVDLVRLVRQTVQDNLGYADEKRIDLNLSVPPKVPKLRGDKQRLSVLLQNLIGNAIKYTPEGGRVQVAVESDESWPADLARIAVSDTGIGISAEDQPHVFDKFYRASDDRVQAIKGTGLGLALAQEVARLHGGEIRLESEPGKGSTFTVELPCASVNAMEVAGR